MQNVRFVSVWRTEKPKGNYVRPNSHAYYELVYYVTGCGVTTIGGTSYTFSGGQFTIIPTRMEHDERLSATADIICLAFSCDTPLPAVLRQDTDQDILPILKAIVEECSQQAYDYEDMVATRLSELLIRLSRTFRLQKTRDKSLEHIIKYIDENYYEKIPLADCANQVQMSYSHFQNKFRRTTGYSPQNYLLKKRLSAARDLLLHTDLNCTEIALRCGFSTSAQFSLLFKKAYNLTPTVYRNRK